MIIYYLTLKILFHKLIQCVLQKEIGAMFFDLLLILSPITLQPKPFFKALYENISNWDDEEPVLSNLFCQ